MCSYFSPFNIILGVRLHVAKVLTFFMAVRMHVHHLLNHFPIDQYLDYFYISTIMNNTVTALWYSLFHIWVFSYDKFLPMDLIFLLVTFKWLKYSQYQKRAPTTVWTPNQPSLQSNNTWLLDLRRWLSPKCKFVCEMWYVLCVVSYSNHHEIIQMKRDMIIWLI